MRPPAAIAAPLLLLAGCIPPIGTGPVPPRPLPPGADPFAPVSVRVHPITHLEAGPDGPMILAYIELKDRYGDTVKALGRLNIQLYRPGAGMAPSMDTQELSWDVPGMDNADTNVRLYDFATRTYRVPLKAPAWVGAALGEGKYVRVHAVFTPANAPEGFLTDDFMLQN